MLMLPASYDSHVAFLSSSFSSHIYTHCIARACPYMPLPDSHRYIIGISVKHVRHYADQHRCVPHHHHNHHQIYTIQPFTPLSHLGMSSRTLFS